MNKTKYVYPAQFINEDNGMISVFFPDLEGCQTYDDTLEGASIMAREALEGYIEVFAEMGRALPNPTSLNDVKVDNGCVMLVVADVKKIEKDNLPVRKVLTIPKWLDREAANAHLNLSGILKEALIERLNAH